MTKNKRFKIYSDFDDWSIIDTTGEYVAEDYLEWMSEKQVCNLLNEQEELIKRLKQIRNEQIETILKLKRKMKELIVQLQTEEDICIKCKYHNLIKYPDESSKYYISKCIKEHDECSKEDIRYCEDFKLISDDGDMK